MRRRAIAIGLVVAFSVSFEGSILANINCNSKESTVKESKQISVEEVVEASKIPILQEQESIIIDNAFKITDDEKKAEVLNSLSDTYAFEYGVKKVMDKYYDNNGNILGNVEKFKEVIDPRAKDIISNYEQASAERNRSDELDYDTKSILVSFDYTVNDDEIRKVINSVSDGGEIITGMYSIDDTLPDEKKESIKGVF